MRAIDCPCGQHFEAATDEALAPLIQAHVAQAHPEVQMTDEEKAKRFAELAHDA
ncbi:MAG TPA: DUF1059 domain-containing protein [Ktedonobacterales bacterium]|nr:DUF1059 domain-containing protein [Ktedonobacterales bacterium]